MTMACVSGSALNSLIASRNVVPMIGIAADADAGGLSDTELGQLAYRLIRQVPEREPRPRYLAGGCAPA